MKLSQWLDEQGIHRIRFAMLAGISQPYVTELCQGSKWPSRDVAVKIMKATAGAVTPNDFLDQPGAD